MQAAQRLASLFVGQTLVQNTYRASGTTIQVLNRSPTRTGFVLRNAGGPNGGGNLYVRYRSFKDFTEKEAIHRIQPQAQLTFSDSGTDTPRQEVQVRFPSKETDLAVAEWRADLPKSVYEAARSVGIRI
jgi:hypothetical protein